MRDRGRPNPPPAPSAKFVSDSFSDLDTAGDMLATRDWGGGDVSPVGHPEVVVRCHPSGD
jgi:hypothetical protein